MQFYQLNVVAWGMGGYRLWYIKCSSCHCKYGIVTSLWSQEILDWDKGPDRKQIWASISCNRYLVGLRDL